MILRGANAELLVINVNIKQLLTEWNVRRLISKVSRLDFTPLLAKPASFSGFRSPAMMSSMMYRPFTVVKLLNSLSKTMFIWRKFSLSVDKKEKKEKVCREHCFETKVMILSLLNEWLFFKRDCWYFIRNHQISPNRNFRSRFYFFEQSHTFSS